MFWHLDTRDSAQKLLCPPFSQAVCFPFSLSAVYSERCIIDSFFPSSLVRRFPCPHIITWATVAVEQRENLTPPGLYFIAWCLIHFWKSSPSHPWKKKKKNLVPSLFQVFVLVRQMERWLEGGTHLQLSQFRRQWVSLGGATEEGRVWMCLFVCMCLSLVIKWWLVQGVSCPMSSPVTPNRISCLENGWGNERCIFPS